jgi:hypothetical protein
MVVLPVIPVVAVVLAVVSSVVELVVVDIDPLVVPPVVSPLVSSDPSLPPSSPGQPVANPKVNASETHENSRKFFFTSVSSERAPPFGGHRALADPTRQVSSAIGPQPKLSGRKTREI